MLQEVDEGADRTDGQDQLALLLDELGDTWTCHASAFYWKAWFVPHPRIMGSVGMKLSTISKYAIDDATRYQLAQMPNDLLTRQFDIRRAILETRLPIAGGGELAVLNTHLDAFAQGSDTMQRQVAQTRELLDDLTDEGTPWVHRRRLQPAAAGTAVRRPRSRPAGLLRAGQRAVGADRRLRLGARRSTRPTATTASSGSPTSPTTPPSTAPTAPSTTSSTPRTSRSATTASVATTPWRSPTTCRWSRRSRLPGVTASSAAPPRGFPREEFEARAERLQGGMATTGIDLLLLTTEPDVRYVTGFDTRFWLSPTRPWFLLLPRVGAPTAVVPEIGAEAMAATWVDDVRTWPAPVPDDDGVTLLAATIRELTGHAGALGVPMGPRRTCGCRWPTGTACGPCCRGRRSSMRPAWSRACACVKSPAEVAKVRHVCGLTCDAFDDLGTHARRGPRRRRRCSATCASTCCGGARTTSRTWSAGRARVATRT